MCLPCSGQEAVLLMLCIFWADVITNYAGGMVTGTLTGLLSSDDSSEHSIIDDTGSESTHISKGITDDGDLFQDDDVGLDLSDGSIQHADTDSDASNF